MPLLSTVDDQMSTVHLNYGLSGLNRKGRFGINGKVDDKILIDPMMGSFDNS